MQRPVITVAAQKAAVLDALAEGLLLAEVCQRGNMPRVYTIARWRREDPDFDADMRVVLEARAHEIAEQMLGIAERAGEVVVHDEVIDADGNVRRVSRVVLDANKVQQDRLRLDTRKWLAGKWFARVYGERATHEHTGEGGGAMRLLIGPTADAYKPKPKDIEQ